MAKAKRVARYVLFPLRCIICGELFHPSRTDAKTCGATCRKRFARAKTSGVSRDFARKLVEMPLPVDVKRSKRKSV